VPEPNSGFVAIAAGNVNSLGLKEDGSIVAWGNNTYGQCDVPSPNTGFVSVSAGAVHGLGLKENGSIVAWGNNSLGQCLVPSPNEEFVAVAGGTYHSLGLKEDSSIVAWGSDQYFQCYVPSPNSGFLAIAAGLGHSLGLKQDGSIMVWGNNTQGQCDVPSPNEGFVAVAGGDNHSLGLRDVSTSIEGADPTGDFIQIQSVAPNPFSISTTLFFQSPGLSTLTLQVYDTAGRLVRTQPLGNSPAGQHSITWDGRDASGAELASGIYFIRLMSTEQQASAKVLLVR